VTRESIRDAHRVVLKVGSSFLTGAAGARLDDAAIDVIVHAAAEIRLSGREVVLVSSGAIAAGLAPLGLATRPRDLATQQAAASVGQGLLLHRYTEAFARSGLTAAQVLLTADDVVRRAHYTNAQRTLFRLLALGVVPVVNENDTVATAEIRFGDNDRLAALVSHLIQADALVLLSDVDGLYTDRPEAPGARRIDEVKDGSDLDGISIGSTGGAGVGTGGMVTKVEAARIASAAGIPTLLAHARDARLAVMGEPVGTYFHPAASRTPSRMLWLAHASSPKGRLVLDEGAVAAVVERRLSLLAAGVTDVIGEFDDGDVVDLVDVGGTVRARGLVNFSADEARRMQGLTTPEIGRRLGPDYERELVHRDDLVVVSP
jgi:glutamate 5-kinase